MPRNNSLIAHPPTAAAKSADPSIVRDMADTIKEDAGEWVTNGLVYPNQKAAQKDRDVYKAAVAQMMGAQPFKFKTSVWKDVSPDATSQVWRFALLHDPHRAKPVRPNRPNRPRKNK